MKDQEPYSLNVFSGNLIGPLLNATFTEDPVSKYREHVESKSLNVCMSAVLKDPVKAGLQDEES